MVVSQTARAYERLKELILDLELHPGEGLTERRLMELTGSGRTPVREAMQGLQRDGLLQIVPFRGAFVSAVSSKDVEEIGQVRELLESFAARLAARLIAPQELERLHALLDALEPLDERMPRDFFATDRAFHSLIVEASGHRRIRGEHRHPAAPTRLRAACVRPARAGRRYTPAAPPRCPTPH